MKRYRINWENVFTYLVVIMTLIFMFQSQLAINKINRNLDEQYAEQKNEVETNANQSLIQLHK